MSEIVEIPAATTAEEKIELRDLTAQDVFPMAKILSKIGINQFMDVFKGDDVTGLIGELFSEGNEQQVDDKVSIVGLTVALDIANIICSSLDRVETDIYMFLASLSGLKTDDIKKLPMNTFFEMIIDVIKKDEFKGFMKVVSKLLK